MASTRQDTGTFLKDLISRPGSHLVLSEDVAYDPVRQPSTWLRATASYPLEREVASVESVFTDEKLGAFEDLPDLKKLFGRTNPSDLEHLPDFEGLFDPEESGVGGIFLPAAKTGRRSPYRFKLSKTAICARRVIARTLTDADAHQEPMRTPTPQAILQAHCETERKTGGTP
jgi:hypothetical protein